MHFPIILSLKCRRHRILFDSSRVRVTWSDSIFICSVIPKIQYFHTEIYTFRNSKWAHIPPSSLFPNHRYGRCKRWLTRFINTFFLTFHAAGFVRLDLSTFEYISVYYIDDDHESWPGCQQLSQISFGRSSYGHDGRRCPKREQLKQRSWSAVFELFEFVFGLVASVFGSIFLLGARIAYRCSNILAASFNSLSELKRTLHAVFFYLLTIFVLYTVVSSQH